MPKDCQGRSPVAWVKYDILTSGVCQRRLTKYNKIAHASEYREAHRKKKLNDYA